MIALEAVELTAGRPVPMRVLGPISVQLPAREVTAVVGPSGAGKTSLLAVIGAMQRPTGGVYRLGRSNVTAMTRRELARLRAERIGFVFQAPNLLDERSAIQNVILGCTPLAMPARQSSERAGAALAALGLDYLADRPAGVLSGGERQRVAFARALVKQPELLVADEPTGNLDSKSGAEVLDLLYGLPERGVTVVLVTHNEEAAAYAGRLLRIRDGLIESEREGDRR